MTETDIMHANRETVFSDVRAGGDLNLMINIIWNDTYANDKNKFAIEPDKGVMCGGAATMLTHKMAESGLPVFQYFYGFTGVMSHVGTVVKADGIWYWQDAYFNEWQPDFFGMLADLGVGLPATKQLGNNHRREMAWHEDCNPPCWPVENPALCKGMVEFTSAHYAAKVQQEPGWLALEPQFTARGLPFDIQYAPCFPYAISGMQGYVTDPQSTAYWGVFPMIYDALGL